MIKKRFSILIFSNSIFNVILITLGLFLNSSFFWGFNLLSFYNLPAAVLVLCLGYLIFIPAYRDNLLHQIEKLPAAIKNDYIPAILISLFIIFFIVFRIKVHFLGDGPMILRMLPQMTGVSDMIATNEPGIYTINLYIQSILVSIMKESYITDYVYLFLSFICGITFILALYYYTNTLYDNDAFKKIFAFVCLLFSPVLLFFLGYAETYQLIYLMEFIFIVTSVLYLSNKIHNIYVTSVTFGIWLALHYLAFVFIPSYIILVITQYKRNKMKAITSVILSVIFFFAMFFLTGLDFADMIKRFISPNEPHWLPLFSSGNDVIPALSPVHLWDIFNLQFLILPFGLFTLIIFIILFFKKIDFKNKVVLFLSVMSLFSLAFIILFKSHMGLSRDWDIAALMSFPFVFFFTYLINSQPELQKLKPVLFTIVYLAVWQTMIWIVLNSTNSFSIERNTHLDNETLWEKTKLSVYYEELGIYYRNNNDLSLAEEKLRKALQYTPSNERLLLNLSSILQKKGQYKEAELLLISHIAGGNSSKKMLNHFGIIEMRLKNFDKAVVYLEKALQKEPNDYEVMGNLSVCLNQKGEYKKSIEYSQKILQMLPDTPLPYITLAESYYGTGDTLKAIQSYNTARQFDKDGIYKDFIQQRLDIKDIKK